jgi:Ca-activated chloride channel family protein
MDKRLLFIFLTMISLITLPSSGQTQARDQASNRVDNFIFIFDGSTSMWRKINGEFRLVIAKDAMKGVIDHLPDGVNTALMSYGHRVERDCTDVEALIPLQALDRKLLKEKIQNIQPKGRTPITYALQQAFAMVPGGETTSIVLLTDGIENCEGDPCQAVQEAKSRGLAFNLNIVGFGVPEAESADLQCSATAGGGQYLIADDADQLVTALDALTDADTMIAATSASRPALNGTSTRVKETRPVVSAANKPAAAMNTASSEPSADSAKAIKTAITAKPEAEMAASESTAAETPAATEASSTKPSSESNPALAPTKMQAADTQTAAESATASQPVIPDKPETEEEVTTIAALNISSHAEANDITLEAPAEVVADSSFNVQWKGTADDWDYITTVEAGAGEGSYTQYGYTKDGNVLTLQAPSAPGDYEIRYVEGTTQNTLTRLPLKVR